jgi:hypothetical protein
LHFEEEGERSGELAGEAGLIATEELEDSGFFGECLEG